jgi:NADH dehydrogenase [ubiquinone] 1 alpha subcomplex assembly factor 6
MGEGWQDSVTRETRKGGSRSEMVRRQSPLAALVHRHDRDRYQTALFAPVERREALFALYAFNYEIARVRETVTQPMLGQIRLQWWREAIDAAFAGAPVRQHDVAAPLAAAIREFALTRAPFDRMIDTRERDLADEPPATLAALEEYAEGTSATLLALAVEALGASQTPARPAAREIGIGYALAGLLRAMPFHARAGRRYIPADAGARFRLDLADYAGLRDSAGLRAATAEIAESAAGHLQAARRFRYEVPREARAALLPAVVADRFLARLERTGCNPFAPELAFPDPLQSWRLFAAALRGRF